MRLFKKGKSGADKTIDTWDPEQEIDSFIELACSGDKCFLSLCECYCVDDTYNAIIDFDSLQPDEVGMYFNYYIIPNKDELGDVMGRKCTNLNLDPAIRKSLIDDYHLYLEKGVTYLNLIESLRAALRFMVGEIVSDPLCDIMKEYQSYFYFQEGGAKRCVIS